MSPLLSTIEHAEFTPPPFTVHCRQHLTCVSRFHFEVLQCFCLLLSTKGQKLCTEVTSGKKHVFCLLVAVTSTPQHRFTQNALSTQRYTERGVCVFDKRPGVYTLIQTCSVCILYYCLVICVDTQTVYCVVLCVCVN